MRLFTGKKGQYVTAQLRERRQKERDARVYLTYKLLREKNKPQKIAVLLGVSTNTVKTYISEINSNKDYFEQLHQKVIAEEKKAKEEEERKANRTLGEVIVEESLKSITLGLAITIGIYATWWLFALIFAIIFGVDPDHLPRLLNVVYGTNFFYFLIVSFLIIHSIRVSRLWQQINVKIN